MLLDLREELSKLAQAKGLRNSLWLLLIGGLVFLVFESVTQYFAVSSLQARVNLLTSLAQIDSGFAEKTQIGEIQKTLLEEAKAIQHNTADPGAYIFERIVRFVKGAYLSLPLFYLLFKVGVVVIRQLKEEQRKLALLLGSMLVSGTAWFATVLGSISVIWNNSESIFISWIVFPLVSFLVFLPFAIWLGVLRIVLPSAEKHGS